MGGQMKGRMKKQAGFTLIELIMVIVILGVLSAFALPRFADLGGQARIASLDGLVGALRSSMNIAHAQQLAIGATENTSVELEGATITMLNGYPTADVTATGSAATGIALAAQVDLDDYPQSAGTGTPAELIFTLQENCFVTYTPATATAIPTVVATTTGC